MENATGPPDVVRLLPAASIACTLSTTVSSVVTTPEETAMVEVSLLAIPIAKVIVGLPVVMVSPFIVAEIVTVSTVPLVMFAV